MAGLQSRLDEFKKAFESGAPLYNAPHEAIGIGRPRKMATLQGKTALVTGASRGIERATALALADAGARVLVYYRRAAASSQRAKDPNRIFQRSRLADHGKKNNNTRREWSEPCILF